MSFFIFSKCPANPPIISFLDSVLYNFSSCMQRVTIDPTWTNAGGGFCKQQSVYNLHIEVYLFSCNYDHNNYNLISLTLWLTPPPTSSLNFIGNSFVLVFSFGNRLQRFWLHIIIIIIIIIISPAAAAALLVPTNNPS